jgi:peptide/nickel transport system permease protein
MLASKEKNELLYFALRNNKLKIGMTILVFFIVLTFVGPLLTDYKLDYIGPCCSAFRGIQFGTTTFGQDVFTQFVRQRH